MKVYEQAVISLMSPSKLLSLSSGEVKNADTLHPVTDKPKKDGLFCQRIFGPVDYGVCGCNRFHPFYRRKKITCPDCGVTLDDPIVRRRRMAHISLVVPVVHIWYRKIIATLLAIPPKKLDQLIECRAQMIVQVGQSKFKAYDIVTTPEYERYKEQNPEDRDCIGHTGGNLISALLTKLDLQQLVRKLRAEAPSVRVNKRLLVAQRLLKGKIDPSWMVMKNILVLPPGLRPMFAMEDGRILSSDLNDLYAKIIHRNIRLARLYEMKAPFTLINTGKAQLQMAVDALIANGKKIIVKNRSNKRVLKSLTSMIEKKTGILRRNLLGKRVNYSARSVIVVGPELKLNQVGLPLHLALDMFKPFVYGRLRRRGIASCLDHARIIVDKRQPEAIDALEYEMAERVVILNRAPTLHRMGMQAFYPIIVKGRAIMLHPLTCAAFNADFDGDQMGVHLPVSIEAQIETRVLMLATNNVLSPANGKISLAPSQDMVLGIYYLTKDRAGLPGEGKYFADRDDAMMAFDNKVVELQSKIIVRIDGSRIETTAGRIIFSSIMPRDLPFSMVNKTFRKKDIGRLVDYCYEELGEAETVRLLDRLKEIGFKYATYSGISLCMDDITIPKSKEAVIKQTEDQVKDIQDEFNLGVGSEAERYNKTIEAWKSATNKIGALMMQDFGVSDGIEMSEQERLDRKEFNSLFMMADSGARGSEEQIRQVAGMRGLMAKPNGDIVEFPIRSNFKEGLTYHEYLLSCHGARKGRADGALKTANAGYFTRRLVDAAHNIIINEQDCHCLSGLTIEPLIDNDTVIVPLGERITGRTSMKTIKDRAGNMLVVRNEVICKETAKAIEEAGITAVEIRSPVTCALKHGICAYCYGSDLSTKELPEIGMAAGIIAAQSVGEPGTQLTLRTFHSGGSASGGTVISTLNAKSDGKLIFVDINSVTAADGSRIAVGRNGSIQIKKDGVSQYAGSVRYGAKIMVEDGAMVNKGDTLTQWDAFNSPICATNGGRVTFADMQEGLTVKKESDAKTGVIRLIVTAVFKDMIPKILVGEKEYVLPIGAFITVNEHDQISPGTVVANIPQKAAKNSDITGGIDRVLQILEARLIQDRAILAEIDGIVTVNPPKGKQLSLQVTADSGLSKSYVFPIEKQANVLNGDIVKAGEILVSGTVDIRDVLRICGPDKAALFIIDEVQKVYRSQGVEISDKHLEIIAKKMLGKVRIINANSTEFTAGEIVSKTVFLEANKQCSGKKATAEPIVLSLTKSALLSDSWLSAASFQNTTEVLANAAIQRKADELHGTKENIILCNPIPVGTGHKYSRNIRLVKKGQTQTEEAMRPRQKREAIANFLALFGE